MNKKEPTVLENILKLAKINPLALGISAVGLASSILLNDSDSMAGQIAEYAARFAFGSGLGLYAWNAKNALRDLKILDRHGFRERHGKKRMRHYCDRQAFYAAASARGFQDEARALIDRTQNSEKKLNYVPIF